MARFWRIIIEGYEDGSYNMAKDELLYISYKKHRLPTLRIYSWRTPFLSLGYFQNPLSLLNIEEAKKMDVGIVRRITGGGIILHHQELTYSLVCSRQDLNLPSSVRTSYHILNQFLIDFYKCYGIEASFSPFKKKGISSKEDFCFFSYEPYDIIVKGRKIGGNAQRRGKDIIFQHGCIPQRIDWQKVSVLLKRFNKEALNQTITFDDVLSSYTRYEELKDVFLSAFIKRFSINPIIMDLNKEEKEFLRYLCREKYEKDEWNIGYVKTKISS